MSNIILPLFPIGLFYFMLGGTTGMILSCAYDFEDDDAILGGAFWPWVWAVGLGMAFIRFVKGFFRALKRLFQAFSNKLGSFRNYLNPFHGRNSTKWLAKGVPSPTYTLCGMIAIRMVKYPTAYTEWDEKWKKDDIVVAFDYIRTNSHEFKVRSLVVGGEVISLAEHPDGARELLEAREKCINLNKIRKEEEARIAAEKKSTDAIEHLLKLDPPAPKPHVGTYTTPCTLSCCKDKVN